MRQEETLPSRQPPAEIGQPLVDLKGNLHRRVLQANKLKDQASPRVLEAAVSILSLRIQ